VDQFAGTNGAFPPPKPPSRGPRPTIVDWLFLAHVAPETKVNTADAASIAGIDAIRVRRLIKAGALKSATKTKPYVLKLTDVLAYRLHKGAGEGGAS